jgi:hypothetical protein
MAWIAQITGNGTLNQSNNQHRGFIDIHQAAALA